MPTPTYEAIASATPTGVTTYTFSSIPSTYTDLILVTYMVPSGASTLYYRVNGDTGANYSQSYLFSVGTGSATAARDLNANYWWAQNSGGSSSDRNMQIARIFNYANTNIYKNIHIKDSAPYGSMALTISSGHWRSTAAIAS